MKIVKEGKFELKKTCKGCKSVLVFDDSDMRYGLYSSEYEQEFVGQFYVECPVCGKKLIQKDLPEQIKEQIRNERAD